MVVKVLCYAGGGGHFKVFLQAFMSLKYFFICLLKKNFVIEAFQNVV